MAAREDALGGERIEGGQLGRSDLEAIRYRLQGFSFPNLVAAPVEPPVRRHGSDFAGEFRRGSGRQGEVVAIGRRRGTKQGGIEFLDGLDRDVRRVGDEGEAGFRLRADPVVPQGRSQVDFADVEEVQILADVSHRQDDGHVVASFPGQGAAADQCPVVPAAGSADGRADTVRPAVVGGHGQVPVSELDLQILQVLGGRARRGRGVVAQIHVAILAQAVLLAAGRHELPHARRPDTGMGFGPEAGLGHREIEQLLGHVFFPQDALDHRPVGVAAAEGGADRGGAPLGLREVVDQAFHVFVHDQRQLGARVQQRLLLGQDARRIGQGQADQFVEECVLAFVGGEVYIHRIQSREPFVRVRRKRRGVRGERVLEVGASQRLIGLGKRFLLCGICGERFLLRSGIQRDRRGSRRVGGRGGRAREAGERIRDAARTGNEQQERRGREQANGLPPDLLRQDDGEERRASEHGENPSEAPLQQNASRLALTFRVSHTGEGNSCKGLRPYRRTHGPDGPQRRLPAPARRASGLARATDGPAPTGRHGGAGNGPPTSPQEAPFRYRSARRSGC